MIPEILISAFSLRASLRVHEESEAIRLFYGPGETDHSELRGIAIDRFKDHLWITQWNAVSEKTLDEVCKTLMHALPFPVRAIVLMDRSEIESDAEVRTIFGEVIPGRFQIEEFGIPYLVQMEATKHPGLFLDHAPLRLWLKETQESKSVLNLFAYTGSLSVAAGKAGASKVTTLDLSKPTIDWARENWVQAGLPVDRADFIFGDVFEWLPKIKKRGTQFDTILSDPPSFSRSKNGTFSTKKDLSRLHEAILPLLAPGGILVTSINSENISERQFLSDIENAAKKEKCTLQLLSRIDLPPTFPTSLDLGARYLKGFYLKRVH